MQRLDEIIEKIHQSFDTRTKVRDQMLKQARILTRHCANAIRATHRDETALAQEHLQAAKKLVTSLENNSDEHADFYHAGYTQDALKEYAEANITFALINGQKIPSPEDLGVEHVPYLKGLAETAGELRRRCLDILRHDDSVEAGRLLDNMDDIYAVLVTMDYPDAITGGLRRLTDIVRSITERTRGDITMSLRQERLEKRLQLFEERVSNIINGDREE
jgi:translin